MITTIQNSLRRVFLLAVICVAVAISASADGRRHGSNPEDRHRWEGEMLEYKHQMLERELNLKDSQKTRFFALYDALDRERRAQFMKAREKHSAVAKKANPTNAEYNDAINTECQVANKIAALQSQYYREYAKILTPEQLFKLSSAERKIMRDLRRHVNAGKK